MLTKPEGCKACPLYHTGRGFVPDKQARHVPDYVFVGEAPGTNEIEQGEPFVGKAGYVLKEWLMKAVPEIQIAQEKGKITFANTLRCLPPEVQGRPYPKGEEKELAEACCAQYAQWEQGAHRVVVLFGESPQRRYFKEELSAEDVTDHVLKHELKGVTGRIGRVYIRDGVRWVFAPHPAYILRQPALVQHGQQALRIAVGSEKITRILYKNWSDAIGSLTSR